MIFKTSYILKPNREQFKIKKKGLQTTLFFSSQFSFFFSILHYQSPAFLMVPFYIVSKGSLYSLLLFFPHFPLVHFYLLPFFLRTTPIVFHFVLNPTVPALLMRILLASAVSRMYVLWHIYLCLFLPISFSLSLSCSLIRYIIHSRVPDEPRLHYTCIRMLCSFLGVWARSYTSLEAKIVVYEMRVYEKVV